MKAEDVRKFLQGCEVVVQLFDVATDEKATVVKQLNDWQYQLRRL